jgi:hypothetical protein
VPFSVYDQLENPDWLTVLTDVSVKLPVVVKLALPLPVPVTVLPP